ADRAESLKSSEGGRGVLVAKQSTHRPTQRLDARLHVRQLRTPLTESMHNPGQRPCRRACSHGSRASDSHSDRPQATASQACMTAHLRVLLSIWLELTRAARTSTATIFRGLMRPSVKK